MISFSTLGETACSIKAYSQGEPVKDWSFKFQPMVFEGGGCYRNPVGALAGVIPCGAATGVGFSNVENDSELL